MGGKRRVQANARTLTRAVRQVFQPSFREIPATTARDLPYQPGSIVVDSSTPVASTSRAAALESPTPDDQLIPTQPWPPAGLSAKSQGKRKRLEDDEAEEEMEESEESDEERGSDQVSQLVQKKQASQMPNGVQTRFTKSNIPPALKKYWAQRYRLFSRYDEGIQMDYDGWFSVTPENIAAQIAERCRCKTIVDAFCGVGGNAIQFAMTCEKVIAIDISPVRLACAKANAELYGVQDYITFIQADYFEWALQRSAKSNIDEPIDAVFLSPPWGGIEYRQDEPQATAATPNSADPDQTLSPGYAVSPDAAYSTYPLSRLQPWHGKELFDVSRKLTQNIAYYLPRNLDVHEAAALADQKEQVEVEEEWMGSKLKALCVYYGELAVKPTSSV